MPRTKTARSRSERRDTVIGSPGRRRPAQRAPRGRRFRPDLSRGFSFSGPGAPPRPASSLESRAARPYRFLPAPSTRDGDRMRHEGSGIGRLDSKNSGLETRDPGPAGRRPVFAKTNRTSRKRASQNRLRGRLDGLACVLSPVGTPAGGSDRPPAFGQEIDPTGFGDRRGLTASKDPVPTGLRRAVGLRKRSPPDSRDTSTRDLGFGTGMAPEAPSVERREGPEVPAELFGARSPTPQGVGSKPFGARRGPQGSPAAVVGPQGSSRRGRVDDRFGSHEPSGSSWMFPACGRRPWEPREGRGASQSSLGVSRVRILVVVASHPCHIQSVY